MSAPLQPFSEECAVVLDKWLYDVCGEQMQFPSHRRQQFDPYMTRVRRVMKEREFVAGTFVYPSRNGLREVAVLETLLDCLGYEERKKLESVRQMDSTIESMLQLLEEKTLGASPLLKRKGQFPTVGPSSAHRDPQQEGYQPLVTVDEANYPFHLQLAERYINELEGKGGGASAQRQQLTQEYADLLDTKSSVERETQALHQARQEAEAQTQRVQQQEEEERKVLDTLQEEWKSMQDNTTTGEEEEESNEKQKLVAEKRAQLIDIGKQTNDVKHRMVNEEQVHRGKVRQAKQKVSEWEEIVSKIRDTHDQKKGQVQTISTVMQNTAERLANTNNGSSLMEQLGRLNSLLYQRTAEYMASSSDPTSTSAAPADDNGLATIRPLQPSSILTGRENDLSASEANTPTRHSSYTTPAATPRAGSRGGSVSLEQSPGPAVRRSRYDLVTHLEKWRRALDEERCRMRSVLHAHPSNTPGQSLDSIHAHRRIQYTQLKDILFRQ